MNDKQSDQTLAEVEDKSLRQKLQRVFKKAGKEVVLQVLKLYYCSRDADTPKWALTVIAGALAYFILPIDMISDFLPLGYSDDLLLLLSAVKQVAEHIKPEHEEKASALYDKWFAKNKTKKNG
jgi:uncharacterized membrane protein YkvA (DUF1232 family)